MKLETASTCSDGEPRSFNTEPKPPLFWFEYTSALHMDHGCERVWVRNVGIALRLLVSDLTKPMVRASVRRNRLKSLRTYPMMNIACRDQEALGNNVVRPTRKVHSLASSIAHTSSLHLKQEHYPLLFDLEVLAATILEVCKLWRTMVLIMMVETA